MLESILSKTSGCLSQGKYPDILLAAQLISSVPLFPLNTAELSCAAYEEKKNLRNSIFSETQTGTADVYMEASGFIITNISSNKMTFIYQTHGKRHLVIYTHTRPSATFLSALMVVKRQNTLSKSLYVSWPYNKMYRDEFGVVFVRGGIKTFICKLVSNEMQIFTKDLYFLLRLRQKCRGVE